MVVEYGGADTGDEPLHRSLTNKLRRSKTKEKNTTDQAKGDYHRFQVGNEHYQTKGKVKHDGRLRITIKQTAHTDYLAMALRTAMQRMAQANAKKASPSKLSRTSIVTPDISPRAKLNIVVMVIGSRGDIQPFLKVGKVLHEKYGHRVRIATHPVFREFVEADPALEFFSVGGDPTELMAFMVKNPSLIPSLQTLRAGEIGRRRASMAEMFDGFWRACVNATDDEGDTANLKLMGNKRPFVADAIIANPPSFAHIHCAEALGIPLHLMFTFPYTPTQAFPHPLASVKMSNVDPGCTNFISYPLVEMMIWQGLGDLINDFRRNTLALDPVSTLWAPGATYRRQVPFTYMWSPGLIPKPADWGPMIDISGFVFLDLATSFRPPADLEEFLRAGEPPIYIGFGSIVVDDAQKFTQLIFDAVKLAGVRALVSKGWGGLGVEDVPDNIYMLGNTPHDWLFPKVKACVIHGGAGTTAMALKCGKPTMCVPFFGDQNFWGTMLAKSGAGPEPVPYKSLSVEKLVIGIRYLLTNKAQEAASGLARSIELEGDGAENAVRSFHNHLTLKGPKSMRCSILKHEIAAWQAKTIDVKLSPKAADILVDAGYLTWKQLRLIRHKEWNDFDGPGEPLSGIAGSLAGTVSKTFAGIMGVPYRFAKTTKERRGRLNEVRIETRHAPEEPSGPDEVTADGRRSFTMETTASINTNKDVTSVRQSASESTPVNGVNGPGSGGTFMGNMATGVEQSAAALAKAPTDLAMALVHGFHNAPRLYGDETVRRTHRVSGVRSGLHAARLEFGYGVYDAWSGVVMQPLKGAQANGVAGFVKGTGMGLVGFVLKNLAAIIGPVGYTLKGIVRQVERRRAPEKLIRRTRIAQGQRQGKELDWDERRKVYRKVTEGWHVHVALRDKIVELGEGYNFPGHAERLLHDAAFLFESVDTARRARKALDMDEPLERIIYPDRNVSRADTWDNPSRRTPHVSRTSTKKEREKRESQNEKDKEKKEKKEKERKRKASQTGGPPRSTDSDLHHNGTLRLVRTAV